jgi:hypothetical protein
MYVPSGKSDAMLVNTMLVCMQCMMVVMMVVAAVTVTMQS